MKIIIHQANGLHIGQRIEDGYINLTQMAKAHSKRVADWKENKQNIALLAHFKKKPEYKGFEPLISVRGRNGGTWGHPDIAIQFAQWLNPEFALQVSRWVREWMTTGKNPIQRSQTTANATIKNKPDALQLLDQIQSQINHARLFRHTAHNITDQPIFSKNINRVVHKSMHEQGSILNDCLNKIEDLRELIHRQPAETSAQQPIFANPTVPEPQQKRNQKQEPKPHYQSFVRKEARLTDYQLEQLTILARKLNRQRKGKGDKPVLKDTASHNGMASQRITENTLIRVAVDLLLNNPQELNNLSFLEPPTSNPAPSNQPNYLSFNRKETRLTEEQLDELTKLSRRLNKQQQGGDRITENTLIRSAIDLLLTQSERLKSTLHKV
ncbi:MAG: KilA-N domain-containing protein [Cyanobacteria bacterium J06629_2]